MSRSLHVPLLLLVAQLSLVPAASAAPRDADRLGWYVPDFATVQTGSQRGLLALGVGYAAFDDMLNIELAYGGTPPFLAGVWVHTLALELSLRPYEFGVAGWAIVPFYAGVGGMYVMDDDFFVVSPDPYPSRFYRPTALYFTVHAGFEVGMPMGPGSAVERHSLFVEATVTDHGLDLLWNHSETVGPTEAVALGIGYRIAF